MKIEFLEPANIEYLDAVEFYNLQNKELGDKFSNEIDNTLSIIKKYPESFPNYTEHTKKAVVNIFPYNVIYSIYDGKIIVYAIAHQHRKPNYWSKM